MNAGSKSSKEEQDSITSTDSLQILTDESRLHHLSVPDMRNTELSKKAPALEMDNTKLLINLEKTRLELSAKNAANQGLKSKIAELYMESRNFLEEKQKLYNSVKDTESKFTAAKNSIKWYQKQVHEVQASKKTLQIEIGTYQNMLTQKNLTLMNVTLKYKQLNDDYIAISQKHKKKKDILHNEIDLLRTKNNSIMSCILQPQQQSESMVSMSTYIVLSRRLELAEEKLQGSQAKIHYLEQCLYSSDNERAASQVTCSKQCIQLTTAEENLRSYQIEKSSLAETSQELREELGKLKSENERLQVRLLRNKQERDQVEQAIEQLQSQMTKIIAQHKLLRSRNEELEEKLSAMQGVCDENRRLNSSSNSANVLMFRKLRDERRKFIGLQKQLYQKQSRHHILAEKNKADAPIRHSFKQAFKRNKELREQFKSRKVFEESVDEGYADGSSAASLSLTNLPSPRPLSPTFLNTINDVLVKSKNFWEPIKLGLDAIQAKLDDCKIEHVDPVPSICLMSTPLTSLSSKARPIT